MSDPGTGDVSHCFSQCSMNLSIRAVALTVASR